MSSGPRLNMNHGFMQTIIRNQVDRDNYDKEVKAQRENQKKWKHNHQHKQKKPAQQTYVPPPRLSMVQNGQAHGEETYVPPPTLSMVQNGQARAEQEFHAVAQNRHGNRQSGGEAESHTVTDESESGSEGDLLFKLEYEDQNKHLHYLPVYKHDDPASLAQQFGTQRGLPPPMIKALTTLLCDEVDRTVRLS